MSSLSLFGDPFSLGHPRRMGYRNSRRASGLGIYFQHSLDQPLINTAALICTGLYAYKAMNTSQGSNNKRELFLRDHFTSSFTNIRAGRSYTLLTSTFNHGSLKHLLLNLSGLYTFGNASIGVMGSVNTAMVYMLSGLAGNIAGLAFQNWRNPPYYVNGYRVERAHMGASGSISGMAAAFVVLRPYALFHAVPGVILPAWLWMSSFVAYSLWAHIVGYQKDVGHLGHLGGVVAGAVCGCLLRLQRSGWRIFIL